jgi:hypothetical protein
MLLLESYASAPLESAWAAAFAIFGERAKIPFPTPVVAQSTHTYESPGTALVLVTKELVVREVHCMASLAVYHRCPYEVL